jgi:uncharacterized protein (TIGR02284 family)
MALSNAGQEREHPSGSSDASSAKGSASAAPDSSNSASADNTNPLLAQAQGWLRDSGLQDSVTQLPEPLKRLASQAANGWRQLSTSQKVLSGAVLATGWYLLSRSNKAGAIRDRTRSAQAAILHELLLFVNDRIEGYQRAASESKDTALRGYYHQLAGQSQQFANKLNTYLRDKDSTTESGTTLKGKLYRAWMETKAALTGYDEKAILGSNVYGEEWAIKAYEDALEDKNITGALRKEIQRQYAQSKQTYYRLLRLQHEH